MNKLKNVNTRKISRVVINSLVVVLCTIICVVMLYPFYYMITSSFKTMNEYLSPVPTILPKEFTIESYKAIFGKIEVFGKFFLNSLYVSLLIPILQILICLPASYALARLKFKGRDLIFILFISSMMVPGQLTIIQNYVTIVKLDLVNN